jgi:hypothetical protein
MVYDTDNGYTEGITPLYALPIREKPPLTNQLNDDCLNDGLDNHLEKKR